jgi:hypothetical protein
MMTKIILFNGFRDMIKYYSKRLVSSHPIGRDLPKEID